MMTHVYACLGKEKLYSDNMKMQANFVMASCGTVKCNFFLFSPSETLRLWRYDLTRGVATSGSPVWYDRSSLSVCLPQPGLSPAWQCGKHLDSCPLVKGLLMSIQRVCHSSTCFVSECRSVSDLHRLCLRTKGVDILLHAHTNLKMVPPLEATEWCRMSHC